jgi:hypothetical protein
MYAADYAIPTPAKMTIAKLDMEAAYTDVSGRVPANSVELMGGNIGGLTLAPGIHKWSTAVYLPVSSTLTFNGSPSDVWIMQIAGTFYAKTGCQMILEGGAKAENIFWAVADVVAIQVDAQVQGIFLAKTMISFLARSSLTGAALAQTAITMDAATIEAIACPAPIHTTTASTPEVISPENTVALKTTRGAPETTSSEKTFAPKTTTDPTATIARPTTARVPFLTFLTAGFDMARIRAAADGATFTRGGLNKGDIHNVLEANEESTAGTSDELRVRLAGILPAANTAATAASTTTLAPSTTTAVPPTTITSTTVTLTSIISTETLTSVTEPFTVPQTTTSAETPPAATFPSFDGKHRLRVYTLTNVAASSALQDGNESDHQPATTGGSIAGILIVVMGLALVAVLVVMRQKKQGGATVNEVDETGEWSIESSRGAPAVHETLASAARISFAKAPLALTN